jgi:hypothetical protein
MLSTGTFPDRLKYSEIKPIYKKGDKTQITNYGPISLLPVFSKMFEKVLYKRLYNHLSSNNILVKEQFGFRCNTTEMAIFVCYAQTVKTLNERKKRPKRFVAIAKQPRPEILRRGRFVTSTARSGM